MRHKDKNSHHELNNNTDATGMDDKSLSEQSSVMATHTTFSISELETEGRRIVETISQSTTIIKMIAEKNRLVGSNTKYKFDALKQELETAKNDIQKLQNTNMSDSIKLTVQIKKLSEHSDALRNELDKSKNEMAILHEQIKRLEIDNTKLTADNLQLREELERVGYERDLANYWLETVSHEINENLAMATRSAEVATIYEEDEIISTSHDNNSN